jgi:murein DD-endopeptidase MepM/ murein hydrolase activator NlpD
VLAVLIRNSDQLWPKAMLPYHIIRLQTQPAAAALLMPVEGVTSSRVANTWDAPRPGQRKHQGQDIFARRGTPVRAAAEGVVVRIGENRLGGNTVSVAGAGSRIYYYAHLDRYADGLAIGDLVEPGAVLGYVGNTGNARGTPPHLHFGIYAPGGVIDPLPFLVDTLTA